MTSKESPSKIIKNIPSKEIINKLDLENSSDTDDNDNDDDDDVQAEQHLYNGYNPSDFEHLAIPKEIKELFQYITKYYSQIIELENKLCPFIPEYVPAIGDIDAFIKVQHPIKENSVNGLIILDEPCMNQSDPEILQLKLKTISKIAYSGTPIVKKIVNPQQNHKAVYKWIKDLNIIRKNKHSSIFHYSKPMPDIDTLLQEYSLEESSDTTNKIKFEIDQLNIDTFKAVDIACCLLDIPKYEGVSRIEALHLLFSLYLAIKNV